MLLSNKLLTRHMETQHAEAESCKPLCYFLCMKSLHLLTQSKLQNARTVSLALVSHASVLCRPMLTAVTVGMGVRQVSQVSYYRYSFCGLRHLQLLLCFCLLATSQPDLVCCPGQDNKRQRY